MDNLNYTDTSTLFNTSNSQLKILFNDSAKNTITSLPTISNTILKNQLPIISKKRISSVRSSTLIVYLYNSILLLFASQDKASGHIKIHDAENIKTSKQFPLGMSPQDARKLDECIADNDCIGINYTRIDTNKNINYITSKNKTLIFQKLTNFDKEDWTLNDTLFGQGSKADFSSGNEIIIGIKGTASPLPTQASPVQIDSYPYSHSKQQLIESRSHQKPSQGYIAPLTGAIKDEEFYLFKASTPHLYGQRWIVEIPRHQSAHGNTSGYTVRILVKRQ